MQTVVDPSGAEVDHAEAGDEAAGSSTVADEPRVPVFESEPTEFLEEELLDLLEDRPKGVNPSVVGAVQQTGKLYRRDFLYPRGPLLLVGSWWFPPGEGSPVIYRFSNTTAGSG